MTHRRHEEHFHQQASPTLASQEYVNPTMNAPSGPEERGLPTGREEITGKGTSMARDVVSGVTDVGGDIISAAGTTMKAAVNGAAEIGTDVAQVARRTVDGALEATRDIGGHAEEVATVVVKGAINAVGAVGVSAVNAVSGILVGVVEGVRDIASAVRPQSGKSSETKE